MRELEELLSDEPAWPLIQSWLGEATNDVSVLPATRRDGERLLVRLQITSRAPLGAVALETGGILVDHGWVRLLGSGSARMRSTLASWNKLGDELDIDPLQEALIVGFDAVGGFFAINGGEFVGERGHVFYFAPNTLQWTTLDLGYSEFLQWTLRADLDAFYGQLRWPGWQDELEGAHCDLGFSFYPPAFTKEGLPISNTTRRLVPMHELWSVQQKYARQLADVSEGAKIRLRPED